MLGGKTGPVIPALLNIMSSFPCCLIVVSTALEICDSFDTSQVTNWADGPNSAATAGPDFDMSAITTWAPCWMNSWAVAFPSPFAPPVIKATLPSSLLFFQQTFSLYRSK